MHGWRHKFLSRAGKEVLLKAVVQALPSYTMSVFVLPVLLCEELERMMNSFWWGKNGADGRGIRWKSWDKLCARKLEGGLGFRKIHKFNLALVAKQSWKLLTDTNSLASRVFRARYYPNRNFLEAKLGANPSYIWRGIIATQELVRTGVRKRIGTGKHVKIWGDPWLPDNINPYVESDCLQGLASATVDSLRRAEDGYWDIDIVKDIFNERDQNLIMSIPLSRNNNEDRWIWPEDKKGTYTVKSGYKVLTRQNSPSQNNSSTNWKKVWELKVPAKIRNFVWRTLASCLPTMKALKIRKVNVQEWCPLCHQEEEDDFHALISCPLARNVWNISPIGFNFGTANSIKSWWNENISKRDQKDIEVAAAIIWSIWQNRNNVVWNHKSKPADVIVRSATDLLDQWKLANKIPARQHTTSSQETQKHWKKPPDGIMKCNVDAAIFSNPSHAGFGCILRDSQGLLVSAMHGSTPGNHSPEVAEALGVKEALSWLKGLKAQNVIVESDAQKVVTAIKGPNTDISSFGMIIEDCKTIALEITNCSVVYANRSANRAAHSLARAAVSMSGQVGWIYPSPTLIFDVIASELI